MCGIAAGNTVPRPLEISPPLQKNRQACKIFAPAPDGPARPGDKMPTADELMAFPDIAPVRDKLRFYPERAQIYLGRQRMVMMHSAAIHDLRNELVASLGAGTARTLLTRIGFSSGTRDAETALQLHAPDAAIFDLLARGGQLHALQGVALVKMISAELDVAQGRCRLEFLWEHSFEHETGRPPPHTGPAPACWLETGYASGFLSACMGKLILAREIECRATGHEACRVIAQAAADWPDAEEDLRFLNAPILARESAADARPGGGRRGMAMQRLDRLERAKHKSDVVGLSPAFQAVVGKINRVAKTTATVLLLGESGVGKSAFARLLHEQSDRAEHAFVAVNCAAIPETLMEAELFGVERGAFTGADAARAGRFELAEGGTLFLDEIGTLPLIAQSKLLRVLETGEFERLGSGSARHASVRIIAATNEDLWQAVRAGRFREDLFFRLYVFPIEIPPLRERKEDIPVLLEHYLERFAKAYGRRINGLTPETMSMLMSYAWPGNIRELSNVMERAVILSDDDRALDLAHVITLRELSRSAAPALTQEAPQPPAAVAEAMTEAVAPLPPPSAAVSDAERRPADAGAAVGDLLRRHKLTLAQMEKTMVDTAVELAAGNLSRAAAMLGISRGQLRYRQTRRE
ncbi:hypothetical protein BKK81_19890 [Cupriavidus sp. USMAHM13]|nr:hypothetical protein BKK81_19890 [Cupriavidus sp. USMAHM13]